MIYKLKKSKVILTLRTQIVRLQHHKTPFESSQGMLFLDKICLKSDNFKRLINMVLWHKVS